MECPNCREYLSTDESYMRHGPCRIKILPHRRPFDLSYLRFVDHLTCTYAGINPRCVPAACIELVTLIVFVSKREGFTMASAVLLSRPSRIVAGLVRRIYTELARQTLHRAVS